ncbi:MAG: GNAT family N-acetyltransferase [Chitinophagaceae bacterium]|nr:GNAT family N-acetyltransferase [Chitinophagaceae bacterium]
MHIREVKATDNPSLTALIRTVFEEYNAPRQGTVYSDPTTDCLFQLFQKDKAVLWVAEAEGTIIGCCGIYPTESLPEYHAELVKFYLSAHARGKGIGKQLMVKSIESAKKWVIPRCILKACLNFPTRLPCTKNTDLPIFNSHWVTQGILHVASG